ncbi:helix-turn-helix domain-containing protein [Thermovorax subterraneus]|nr:helix-turn-helix domain-containing protein [Thermovorax subterraneus]
MIPLKIGEYIRKIREKKELSINQLALYSKVSAAHISRIERGLREPSPEILKKISEALRVSYEELMRIAGYLETDEWIDINPNTKPNINDKLELTPKDEKDIAKDLEKIMNDLEHSEGLMFYNEPLTDEDKKLLREAIEFGLRIVKQRNKEKYTPKKYRKK